MVREGRKSYTPLAKASQRSVHIPPLSTLRLDPTVADHPAGSSGGLFLGTRRSGDRNVGVEV